MCRMEMVIMNLDYFFTTIFLPSYIDEKDRLGRMTFFIMSKIELSLSSLGGLDITPSKLP